MTETGSSNESKLIAEGRILANANIISPSVVRVLDLKKEGRTGGGIFLRKHDTKRVIIPLTEVCEVTNGKLEKYLGFCEEKAKRARSCFSIQTLSLQSRNPDRDLWGGGYCDGAYEIEFSGLPEAVGEVMIILTMWHWDIIAADQICEILDKSPLEDTKRFMVKVLLLRLALTGVAASLTSE